MHHHNLIERLLHDRTLTLADHLHKDYNIPRLTALRALHDEINNVTREHPEYKDNQPYCLELAYKRTRITYDERC